MFKAVSEGAIKIKAIAIVGDIENYTFPCGICRQVILEFAAKNMEIILAKNENDYIVKTMDEILPGGFTKNNLLK